MRWGTVRNVKGRLPISYLWLLPQLLTAVETKVYPK